MANSPYVPDHATVADSASVTFDGSESETDAAIISGIYGNFDAEIYIEGSDDDGTSWDELSQLGPDDGGADTFSAPFHTQFNRLMVKANTRRVRIENVDSASGEVGIDGDQR